MVLCKSVADSASSLVVVRGFSGVSVACLCPWRLLACPWRLVVALFRRLPVPRGLFVPVWWVCVPLLWVRSLFPAPSAGSARARWVGCGLLCSLPVVCAPVERVCVPPLCPSPGVRATWFRPLRTARWPKRRQTYLSEFTPHEWSIFVLMPRLHAECVTDLHNIN